MTKPNELFNQKAGVHLCFANLLGAGEEKRWGPGAVGTLLLSTHLLLSSLAGRRGPVFFQPTGGMDDWQLPAPTLTLNFRP